MGDMIPLNAWEVGGWGVAASLGVFFVVALLRGYIYPRSVVRDMLDQAAKALQSEKERADTWQASWGTLYEAQSLEAAADRELAVETAALAHKALSTVQDKAEENSR